MNSCCPNSSEAIECQLISCGKTSTFAEQSNAPNVNTGMTGPDRESPCSLGLSDEALDHFKI
jgi:hypothetical protein